MSPACSAGPDWDADGLCDVVDLDDDDDGVLDLDDWTPGGMDTSRDVHAPGSSVGGNAPNAVLFDTCVQKSIDQANAFLAERFGGGLHQLVPERKHSPYDLSGFYARADGLATFLQTTTDDVTPAWDIWGTEMHFVRTVGSPQGDEYEGWGVDTWDGVIKGEWHRKGVIRSDGSSYTSYHRGGGVVTVAFGRLNPATLSVFDERALSITQAPDEEGNCPWWLSLAPRRKQVARSELLYLCSDPDGRYLASPDRFVPAEHCDRGKSAAFPKDILRVTLPCARTDHDGDGLGDCDDDDDDDDGIRDGDDVILGGPSLALDAARPGDEASSAPNAVLEDPCVVEAIRASGWDTGALPLLHEGALFGLFHTTVDDGSEKELSITSGQGDNTVQRGADFDAGGFLRAFVHRSVVGRGDPALDRYARFYRTSRSAQLVRGTKTSDGFRGEFLVVNVAPRPSNPCPLGQGGWKKGQEVYAEVGPAQLEHTCVDEGFAHVRDADWVRSDGRTCRCEPGAAVACDELEP